MKQVMLILGVFCALFLVSCSNTDEVSLAAEYDNAFMDLVNADVYPANQLSEEAIVSFNESFVYGAENEILSASELEVAKELSEENVNLLFDLIAEQDDMIAAKTGLGGTAERYPCYILNKKYKATVGYCVNSWGSRCRVSCHEESPF